MGFHILIVILEVNEEDADIKNEPVSEMDKISEPVETQGGEVISEVENNGKGVVSKVASALNNVLNFFIPSNGDVSTAATNMATRIVVDLCEEHDIELEKKNTFTTWSDVTSVIEPEPTPRQTVYAAISDHVYVVEKADLDLNASNDLSSKQETLKSGYDPHNKDIATAIFLLN